ncbi:MAG TPA: M20/M25/M40 family metallo-hydrolase [Gemmatimonadales bacterium]|nr:M20/M25/M40 family metallo-hydrolase [Gemmatimonadales bacterium]
MRGARLVASLIFPLAAACGGSTTSVTEAPVPRGATSTEISAPDLEVRIAIFSDDSMQGRRTGTLGNTRGNAYIVSELRRLGLRPAGDTGSYLQHVPLSSYAVDSATATLRVGTGELVLWRDYHPYQAEFQVPARPIDGAELVYIGGPADSASLPSREALEGKVVVYNSGSSGNTLGTPDMHPEGPLGLIAGIAVTGVDTLIATFQEVFRTPRIVVKQTLELPPGVTQPRLIILPTASLPTLFGKPLDQLRPGDTGPAIQGDVTFEESDLGASNVVAVLDGSDPALRHQYVALGAHNDAIGVVSAVDHDSLRAYNTIMRPRGANDAPGEPNPEQAARIRAMVDSMRKLRPARLDSIVNGADDDGSGSMALLEIAEAMARSEVRPKRSLLFVWHTGEESGLQGSRWFTDNPTVPRDSIVAQINTDMIGRGGPDSETSRDPAYMQVIGSRRLSTELGDLAEAVNREGGHGFEFDYSYDADGHPDNFYCRSDHYMYARYGIPISFFSTGGHRDYHQVTDEIQYLDFDKYERVTKYVGAVAEAVANLDHRVVVDKPKPDPNAPCKQ